MEIEAVGENFNPMEFENTRIKSWLLLEELSTLIKPGLTEDDAHTIAKKLFSDFESERNWHPTKIRFSQNTLKAFREPSEVGVILKEDDIFFLDLGPVFNGYEGDVGKTFQVGTDPEKAKIIAASEELFEITKNEWEKKHKKGHELYEFANTIADKMGYHLIFEGASGHRISEFPHAVYFKGKLKDFDSVPEPQRWILEIHLHHKQYPYGAFFEDVL